MICKLLKFQNLMHKKNKSHMFTFHRGNRILPVFGRWRLFGMIRLSFEILHFIRFQIMSDLQFLPISQKKKPLMRIPLSLVIIWCTACSDIDFINRVAKYTIDYGSKTKMLAIGRQNIFIHRFYSLHGYRQRSDVCYDNRIL